MPNNTLARVLLPALYQASSKISNESQKKYYLGVSSILGLLIGASIFLLFSGDHKFFAITSVVLLAFSPLLSFLLAIKRYDKIWYGARAVTDSIKTMSWRYMMRAQPYDLETASTLFISDLHQILIDNNEFTQHLPSAFADSEQITEFMDTTRSSDLSTRMNIYLKNRINEQRFWYSTKGNYNKKLATRWFVLMVVFQILAVTSASFKIAYPDWIYLPTGIITTIAASALAWLQARRFQDLGTSYVLTAYEIGLVQSAQSNVESEEEFSDFVGDAENAFSREHTQWRARRDTQ